VTPTYDRIGHTYTTTRREDPRIAAFLREALGDARSVVNIGAGAGAYEPTDLDVLAVEPSEMMIVQRPPGSAPVLRASAERLPLEDHSFDAALAVATVHHWNDLGAGLRELRRVARKRVLVFLRDSQQGTPFWLTRDYLPRLDPSQRHSGIVSAIRDVFPGARERAFHLPRDCADGLFTAYWARPETYLDAVVRGNMSNFALAKDEDVAPGLDALRSDLGSGAWDRAHGHLRMLAELDLGHRLLIADLP
jgi:SAM-dependent methyltransferase